MVITQFKFSDNYKNCDFYCGLDVHKYELAVAIYSDDKSTSEFIKHNVFSVDSDGLNRFWNFSRKYHPKGYVMEATGIYHHMVYNFLVSKRSKANWAFKILVVNPADASGLPGKQKYDKIDAENLARYLAKGLLKNGTEIVVILEDLKAIFRRALRLESDRTALKNRIKKTLDRAGIRPKSFNLNLEWTRDFLRHLIDFNGVLGGFLDEMVLESHPLNKHIVKLLKNRFKFDPYRDFKLSSPQRAILRQDLVELDFKSSRKALLAVEIDQLISEHPGLRQKAHNLASIPGISPYSAVWILSEAGNIAQYSKYSKFGAYSGCCPRVVSSAGKVYSAHISRHSNQFLRTIFYNAAVVVCNLVKKDSNLKRYASRTLKRKGTYSRKLAYSIVAAKISRIVYYVLKKDTHFDPEYGSAVGTQNDKYLNKKFSITDRKLIRRTRNNLKRVSELCNTGFLGEYSIKLANELNKALMEEKNLVV